MNGAIRLISSALRTRCPELCATASIRPANVRAAARDVDELRPLQRQRTVVLREPLRQPQLAGHVGAIEVERLETLRPDALDVPAVEELVRDGVEQPLSSVGNRLRRGDHRAVAMLHAVAVGVGQVVGEKRVVARLVLRILAVDGAFLTDDLLDVLHEARRARRRCRCDAARSGRCCR